MMTKSMFFELKYDKKVFHQYQQQTDFESEQEKNDVENKDEYTLPCQTSVSERVLFYNV